MKSLFHRKAPLFTIRPGVEVMMGGQLGVVIQVAKFSGAIVSFGDDDDRYLTAAQLIESATDPVPAAYRAENPVSFSREWAYASPEARKEALRKQGHVLEVLTGYRSGWNKKRLRNEPFPQYRNDVKLSQRRNAKAESLHMTVQGFRNWEKQFLRGGVVALLDGRSRDRGPFAGLDRAWVDYAETKLDLRTDEAVLNAQNLADDIERELAGTGISIPRSRKPLKR